MSSFQQLTLVLLRTLIGWHFAYEGYYKLMLPGWTPAGQPVEAWSAAGYLRAATGPLAPTMHTLAANSRAMAVVDVGVPVLLLLIGIALILGLFTQLAGLGAALFLVLFYITSIPMSGVPQPNAEGTYLLVNKNLVELAAVLVLLTFRTGQIAGVDVLRRRRGLAVEAEPRDSSLFGRYS